MDQSDAQVIQAIKGLLEWTFQVEIPDPLMNWLANQLRLTWNDGDQSEQQLIAYFVQLAVQLAGTPEPALSESRPGVLQVLQEEFERMELNDRGRTLVLLRGILETLRPGCTHKVDVLTQSTGLVRPTAAPMTGSMFGGLNASAGGGMPSFESLLSGRGAPQAAAPQAAAPQAAAPQAAAGGPAPMPGMNSMLQQQMDAARLQQEVMLQSNMQKRHHEMMMSIINNMG